MWKTTIIACCGLALSACSDTKKDSSQTTDFKVAGTLSSVIVAAPKNYQAPKGVSYAGSSGNTVTHVMAINPQSSNPQRFVSTVSSTGSFSLDIASGQPYVLVFISQNGVLTGRNMIAGIMKLDGTSDLDTLAPTAAGSTSLGTVTVDGAAQQASSTTTLNLTDLGLTTDEATFIGSIDDVSLRAANPDVDGNGVIDALENKQFFQDWHIRANIKMGAGGATPKFSDIENADLATSGGSVVTLDFNLGSAYAVYSDTFSTATCASSGSLTSGCAFRILDAAGADVTSSWVNTTFSGGSFSSNHQWGPDYLLGAASGQDLPGSGLAPVVMEYTLETGKVLTFSHVKTRSKTTLVQDGTIIPFLRINTVGGTAGAAISSVDYKWMKLSGGSWSLASDSEIDLLVNDQGGYAKFYSLKTGSTEEGASFRIPKTAASGTIAWTSANVTSNSTSLSLSAMTTASFCSSAVSYDDKLGLRIFAGALDPNAGVTACY